LSDWIKRLNLRPHPEGGYYRESIRSPRRLEFREPLPEGASRTEEPRTRDAVTSIEFLLTAGEVSRWHCVQSDEVWIWLDGAPLLLLDAPGQAGPSATAWHLDAVRRQALIPARHWQAARSQGDFTLCACVVAPGFDFADFELISENHPLAPYLANCHPEALQFL
jgi:uncharacterized protein